MKLTNKIILVVLSFLTLLAACKKNDNNSTTNSWKIGPNTYTSSSVSDTLPGSLISSSGTSLLWISFADTTLPTVSGNYQIVEIADDEDEIDLTAIALINGVSTIYSTKDNSGVTATVTVKDGKTTVTIPEVWGYNEDDLDDSVKLSATLTK